MSENFKRKPKINKVISNQLNNSLLNDSNLSKFEDYKENSFNSSKTERKNLIDKLSPLDIENEINLHLNHDFLSKVEEIIASLTDCHPQKISENHNLNQKKKLKNMRKIRPIDSKNRETKFSQGRWLPEEHQRFIEAILKYGNEWKKVQKHVKTRSSAQARSHAQKFFHKIKKHNIIDMESDSSKESIKSIFELMQTLDKEKFITTVKSLNLAFDRNCNFQGKSDISIKSDCESNAFFSSSNAIKSEYHEELYVDEENSNKIYNLNETSDSSQKKPKIKIFGVIDEKQVNERCLMKKRNRTYSNFSRILKPECLSIYENSYFGLEEKDELRSQEEQLLTFQNCFSFVNHDKIFDFHDEEIFLVESNSLKKENSEEIKFSEETAVKTEAVKEKRILFKTENGKVNLNLKSMIKPLMNKKAFDPKTIRFVTTTQLTK